VDHKHINTMSHEEKQQALRDIESHIKDHSRETQRLAASVGRLQRATQGSGTSSGLQVVCFKAEAVAAEARHIAERLSALQGCTVIEPQG